MVHIKRLAVFVLCLPLVAVLGCGNNVPMSGKVTFSDDGSPLTVGTVVFSDGKFNAQGELDANGRYVLGFEKTGNGLPKGTYKVYVADALVESGTFKDPDGSEMPSYSNVIDEKFESPASSDLSVTVDGSTKIFDFQVDRASKK